MIRGRLGSLQRRVEALEDEGLNPDAIAPALRRFERTGELPANPLHARTVADLSRQIREHERLMDESVLGPSFQSPTTDTETPPQEEG